MDTSAIASAILDHPAEGCVVKEGYIVFNRDTRHGVAVSSTQRTKEVYVGFIPNVDEYWPYDLQDEIYVSQRSHWGKFGYTEYYDSTTRDPLGQILEWVRGFVDEEALVADPRWRED